MNNKPVAELVLERMAVGDAGSLRVNWLIDGYPPVGTKLYTHPSQHDLGIAEAIGFEKGFKASRPAELTDEEMYKLLEKYQGIELCKAMLRKVQEK